VGGDPARLEVYGWASWSPEKAILTLRNPGDRAQDFTANLATLVELPAGSATSFMGRSPWKGDSAKSALTVVAGEVHTFHLQPFEVLTLEMLPLP
jgi:hypothetical protein